MNPATIFDLHLALGYVCWLLVLGAYAWPRLGAMEPAAMHRAIAALHGFRFFGLVFLVPGVVGPDLPPAFADFAAYGDFATGILAMLALLTFGRRPLFWFFVAAFNLVGTIDIVVDYAHGVQLGLPPGALGLGYAIVILYVPLLLITHVAAFALLLRRGIGTGPARQRRAGVAP